MRILIHSKFKKEYKRLPKQIKELTDKKIVFFFKDPFDSRLKVHRLHGKMDYLWSFSVDRKYRLIYEILDEKTFRFYTIGTHNDVYR